MTESEFKQLSLRPRIPYFDTERNRYFGCGMNMGCLPLRVIFKDIDLDKETKTIKISGYIDAITDRMDTIGGNIFRIFVGKVENGDVTIVRTLAEVDDKILVKDKRTIIKLKEGFFQINFAFTKDEHLFIETDEMAMMKEYNIGSLLK